MKKIELRPSEYNPFYQPYLDLIQDVSLLKTLSTGMEKTISFFEELLPEKWSFRYAPDKWTPKDILQHLSDTERVFSYRALSIARNSQTLLPGFDENLFALMAGANRKSVSGLMEEYIAIRKSTIFLFESLEKKQLKNMGIANSHPLSALAAGFIICGHEIHHCNIIKERYLT